MEGLLRAVEKEGPAEWAECARALGVVARRAHRAGLALRAAGGAGAGTGAGAEHRGGGGAGGAAAGARLRGEEGVSHAERDGCVVGALERAPARTEPHHRRLLRRRDARCADAADEAGQALLPAVAELYPVLPASPFPTEGNAGGGCLLPFMQEMLYELMARNTDDSEPAPNDYEEDSDCPCLLQQCA